MLGKQPSPLASTLMFQGTRAKQKISWAGTLHSSSLLPLSLKAEESNGKEKGQVRVDPASGISQADCGQSIHSTADNDNVWNASIKPSYLKALESESEWADSGEDVRHGSSAWLTEFPGFFMAFNLRAG